MQIAIKKYASNLPVWMYRWMLCLALVAFIPGKARVIASESSPLAVHPAQHGFLEIDKSDQSHGNCHEYVSHPRKHHHIVRRRQSSPILSRDVDVTTDITAVASYIDLHRVQSYCSDDYLRPSYYVFLFRYALF